MNPTEALLDNELLHKKSFDKKLNKKMVYNLWANSYDNYVKSLNYVGPTNLIRFLKYYISSKSLNNKINILDFGCGTGILGEEICSSLNKPKNLLIHGIDISEKMILKAQGKKIYDSLKIIDIHNEIITDKYDFIVSSGVFLEGHVEFILINKLLELLTKNGIIFLTVRESYIETNNKSFVTSFVTNPKIKKLNIRNIDYLDNVSCKLLIIFT